MACEEIRQRVSDGDGRVLRGRRVRAHLRDCQACAAFAAAIPARRGELQALVPVLPAAASAAMLTRLIGSGSGHGAGSGAGALAAGAAGKSVGATIAAKALVGAAIVATAAVGVTRVTGILTPAHHRPASVREPSGRSAPPAASSPTTQPAGPTSGAHARGPLGRRAASVHRNAAARQRGRTHNKSRRPTSTIPRSHHGRGTPKTIPSHAHGGAHGNSTGTVEHRPVSPGRSGAAHTRHATRVGASHGKVTSTVATPTHRSPPAPSKPSPPGHSRTH